MKSIKYYPCESCFSDWIGYQPECPEWIGTSYYQECGDGCCWNRGECEDCNGTGLEEVE